MKRTNIALLGLIAIVLGILTGVLPRVQGQEDEKKHWTYEGEEGPEHWGELSAEYVLCATGEAQSPIDVHDSLSLNLVDLELSYQPSALHIFNNGHTIQVDYDAGSSVVYNENTYELAQFHFHTPSEHKVEGQPAAMEIHFVHKDAQGNLLVIGVLLVEGEEDNPAYADIFANLPAEEGKPEATELMVYAGDLMPEAKTYYTYIGSLTTPPCSQGVRWILLTTPLELSAAQIEAFQAIFEMNARPVQDLNQRDLLQDSN